MSSEFKVKKSSKFKVEFFFKSCFYKHPTPNTQQPSTNKSKSKKPPQHLQ
jgi:hypothetical protein